MTLLLTTCFAYAIVRFFEECARYLYTYFFYIKKEAKISEYKRLTANVSPEIYELVKSKAIQMGLTVTQYTFQAVMNQLKQDGSC